MTKSKRAIAVLAICAVALAACGGDDSGSDRGLPQGSEKVDLKAADFSTKIDNPYLPMAPGSRWVYRETDTEGGDEQVVITVTERTRKLANGITARVVRDVALEDGKPVEIEHDWFAQDKHGNVWFFGGETRTYEDGRLKSRESFEAGVKGADAGVTMPADPKAGVTYRQEYLKGSAEDYAEIMTVGKERVDVTGGFFKDIVLTRDLNRLEPKVEETKYYQRGVGVVLTMNVNKPGARAELIKFTPGG